MEVRVYKTQSDYSARKSAICQRVMDSDIKFPYESCVLAFGALAVKFVRLFNVARQKTMKTLAFSDSLLGNAKREWLSAKCITLKSVSYVTQNKDS